MLVLDAKTWIRSFQSLKMKLKMTFFTPDNVFGFWPGYIKKDTDQLFKHKSAANTAWNQSPKQCCTVSVRFAQLCNNVHLQLQPKLYKFGRCKVKSVVLFTNTMSRSRFIMWRCVANAKKRRNVNFVSLLQNKMVYLCILCICIWKKLINNKSPSKFKIWMSSAVHY